jgi:hypothetical protein
MIPVELQALDQWVVWRCEVRDAKPTKVPYRPAEPNVRASTTDPATWSDYRTAAAVTDAGGIGFVFAEGGGLAGVDLDHCIIDGKLDARAAAIVMTLDSYTEVSPSGTGVHVIIRAELNGTRRRRGNFEAYDRGRFFCVTGDHLPDTPLTVNERQGELAEVHAAVFPPAPPSPPRRPVPVAVNGADDHELLERASRAKNGHDFDALYRGNREAYPSPSEADLALVNMLAFWTGPDPERIDRLFRASGLIREKWDEARGDSTYGAQTIARALEGRTHYYRPQEWLTSKPPRGQVIDLNTERAKPPSETPPNLVATLDASEAFTRRYVALSEAQYVAVTLWIAHTHALGATGTTPYLHVISPEPDCGKTRLLETIEPQTPSPMFAANLTTAVLFRAVEQFKPTLFVDEADNLLRDRESKSDLLGMLNAGYRRGAHAFRMGGGNRDELKRFEPFGAKVIAGLDDLIPTLASRCLKIEMRRRSADELVEDFFREEAGAEAEPIRDAFAAWAEHATEELRRARPERLGVRDRLEESLRLLLAIAGLAGDRWDTRAREALREISAALTDESMGERLRLLADIRQVFEDEGDPAELTTAGLLTGLMALEEAPWRGWWGVEHRKDDDVQVIPSKGAGRKLSERLRAHKIKSTDVGPENGRRKGYRRTDFEPVWRRYLADPSGYPRMPRIPLAGAKNEAPQSAQDEYGCADTDTPQTRIPEPDARNARIEGGGQP